MALSLVLLCATPSHAEEAQRGGAGSALAAGGRVAEGLARGAAIRLGADLFQRTLADMGYEGVSAGDNWMNLALLHIWEEQYGEALVDAERMIEAYRAADTPDGYAYELYAWCLEEMERYDEARDNYQLAKEAYERTEGKAPPSVYYSIAWHQYEAGDSEAALPNFELAANGFKEAGEPVDPYIYFCLAMIHNEKGKSGAAEAFTQLALEGYRQQIGQAEPGAPADIGAYFNMAELYNITGRNAAALTHYLRVEEMMEAENREASGYLYDVIAWYQKDAGNNAQALQYYRRALAVYLEEGEPKADMYFWFAGECEELGEPAEALENYELAIAEYEKAGIRSENEMMARLRRDALRARLQRK